MRINVLLALLCMILTATAGAVLAQSTGDKDLGQYLASECVACHQVSGKSDGNIPPVAGLPEDHISTALAEYKSRQRKHDVMNAIAARLSPDDINALAAYFASLGQ